MKWNRVIVGDVREALREVPKRSVQCVVTSPPYWALRDYGTGDWVGGDPDCDHSQGRGTSPRHSSTGQRSTYPAGAPNRGGSAKKCRKCGAVKEDNQIGLEQSPQEYIDTLVEVFRLVRRRLRDDGVLFLNLGDTYASGIKGSGGMKQHGPISRARKGAENFQAFDPRKVDCGLPAKNMMMMPARLAIALQADGWVLRNDIIWHRPNAMPTSQDDRCTNTHEHLFLLAKRPHYFFDSFAIREPIRPDTQKRYGYGFQPETKEGREHAFVDHVGVPEDRSPRDVWTIPVKGTKEAHFATFPATLVERCIKAGTSDKGCCPQCGAPWERRLKKKRVSTRPGTDTKVNGKSSMEVGNRDPERHVTETEMKGWKQGCNCRFYRLRNDAPSHIIRELESLGLA